MRKTNLFILSILMVISASCTMPYLCQVRTDSTTLNETIMTDELKEFLDANPKPKLVIRIPNPPSNVTEAEKFNRYVNVMEKILIRNGYTIRDRALLENLLRSESADYRAIGERIDTDIIIDVLFLQFDIPNKVRTYLNLASNQEELFIYEDNYIDCFLAKLECRVTLVEKGQLGGIFTLNISLCDLVNLQFILDPHQGLMSWAGSDEMVTPTFRQLTASFLDEALKERATEYLTTALISELMSGLRDKFNRMTELYTQHQYEQAMSILGDLISKDPKNCQYYQFSGMIYARKGDFQRAQQDLDKAMMYALSPGERTSVNYTFSNFYALKNEKKMALSFLRKALEGGFRDFQHIRSDEDLANIIYLEEFKNLLNQYEKK